MTTGSSCAPCRNNGYVPILFFYSLISSFIKNKVEIRNSLCEVPAGPINKLNNFHHSSE